MASRGLFLDLDGTLADSLPAMEAAYRALLRRFGREGSVAEFQSLNGPPAAIIVERIAKAHALPVSPDELLAIYRDLVAQAHRAAPPAVGARQVLERARKLEWTTAVVTSAASRDAREWLARVGLAEFVSVVVGGDEVRYGKPDPEPYRVALQRTGCVAQASLAVEDSASGARAALAAGLPTWLLGDRPNRDIAAAPLFRGCLADLHALLASL